MKIAFVCSPVITGLPIKISNTDTYYTLYMRMCPLTGFTPGKVVWRGSYHEGTTTWNFDYEDQAICSLSIVIMEDSATRAEFCRLTLPLRWFEPNTVIAQSFPMKVVDAFKDLPVMMQVHIHLCENGEPAFLARPGRMTVAPAWEVQAPPTPQLTFQPPQPQPQQYHTPTEEDNDIPPIEGMIEPQPAPEGFIYIPCQMPDGSIQMMWCKPMSPPLPPAAPATQPTPQQQNEVNMY